MTFLQDPLLGIDEATHVHIAGPAAIDVTLGVRRDAFRHVGPRRDLGDEGRDLAVLHAADPDSLLEGRIDLSVVVAGLMVGRIENVVPVDIEPARATELLPFREELSVLIEYLNAAVAAVADEQTPGGIHGERMRGGQFTRSAAVLAPFLDELSVLVEFDDSGGAFFVVSRRDDNIAIWRHHDVSRLKQRVLTIARNAGLAERHQDLAVRTEFVDRVPLAVLAGLVRCPDIALPVDVETMRPVDQAFTEARNELAALIELHDR